MKPNYFIFIFLTIIFSSLSAADITFSFANEIVQDGYYEFDVMVKDDSLGTYLKDVQIYINYNSSGFGNNVYLNGKVDVLFGALLSSGNFTKQLADNADDILSITSGQFQGFSNEVEITDSFQQLFHIKLKIHDSDENSMLSFNTVKMENQQYYNFYDSVWKNRAYENEIAHNTSDDPLPVTLSTFSGVQDGDCVQLYWVTQSESNNWLWNVYRSATSDISNSYQHNGMPIWGSGTSSNPTQYSYLDDEIEENIPFITYYYWLESVDYGGEAELFGPISLNYSQSGESISAPELNRGSSMSNHPNPFNPNTNIDIIVAEDVKANLKIYNMKGQLIEVIFENQIIEKDRYNTYSWDAEKLPNGIYFAKLAYENRVKTHRMILLK